MKIVLIDEDGEKSKEYETTISKDDFPDTNKITGFSPTEEILEIKIKGKLREGE